MSDTYANFPGARASCAKEQQQFYNYQAPATGTFNLEPYPAAQTCYKNTFNSFELPAWTEEALKIPDRIEMIEITSKDLSPASFCSNLDLFAAPDLYKNNTFNQWYNQKPVELPSCAQANIESSKYCSIQTMQKPASQDYYYNTEMFCEQPDYYNCFDNFEIGNFQPVVDQSSDSDIVVEESSDSDESPSEISKCFICNVKYTPLGTQFYHLGPKAPLTMTTQKPVFVKIAAILGQVCGVTKRYLCSECLGLINTIDHLQMKLESFSKELLQKFQKTCGENVIKIRKKKKACSAFKCKKCNRVLSLKHYHAIHMKKHKFRGFLCEVCGEIFKSKIKFLNHKETHQKTKIAAFNCSNCFKSFRTKSNLTEHKNYCLGTLPYNCKFCDKKFASSTKLKSHVKLKHDKKFVAICSICNTGFVNISDYKAHKISHGSDKKFNCAKCGNAYKTLSNLNFHMKIHSKKLPFICTICDKGFTRKDYLEAHVNKHNGIKNYVCTICDKRFIWQKTLDSHLKSHDGTTKGKSCNVCGKVLKIGLEEHMRIHNNLREFECDQCDNRFNTKGTLAKHKKIKHNKVQS